jgi:uncharacterized spore protein YtfJ
MNIYTYNRDNALYSMTVEYVEYVPKVIREFAKFSKQNNKSNNKTEAYYNLQ